MKKVYKKPALEVELYELNKSIASQCAEVIDMGPDMAGAIKVCESWYESEGLPYPPGKARTYSKNIDFWNDTVCDCYTTASDKGYFTS